MSAHDWKEVEELLHQAMALAPERRACHQILPQAGGNGRKSGRRVGLTRLTRRCRARARTSEQPGQTKDTARLPGKSQSSTGADAQEHTNKRRDGDSL
jgi:hypothetical protein